MKIVFFGSPEFAVNILNRLINEKGCEVVGVVTQPDKRAGRGRKLKPTPVKQLAVSKGIPVFEPGSLKDYKEHEFLKGFKADIFVVVAYGLILPEGVISIPPYGTVNVHGSLLPKYRGAAPIQWAILNGEKVTGITIMQMDAGLDTGPILMQRALAIGINDTAQDIHNELSKMGGELLIETLHRLKSGSIIPIPQDNSLASYAPKLPKDTGLIDWNDYVINIHNRIRGLYPWPMAYFYFPTKKNRIKIQIYPGQIGDRLKGDVLPGTILGLKGDFLEIACIDKTYLIPKLKPQSSKILTPKQFMCGYVTNN